MLTTGLMLLAVSAAPIKVAATRLNVVDASEARADFYTEHFADRLADQGLEVTSPREVSTILGLERQKQLLGCNEDTSCLTEIVAALGVDGVALGGVAKVGTAFQVNLKILSPQSGKRLVAFSAMAASEEELMLTLTRGAEQLAQQLSEALGRPLPPHKAAAVAAAPAQASSGGARKWWWIPAVVGVVGVAGGTAGLVSAEAARQRLLTETLDPDQAQQVLQSGQTARALGWVGIGVGAAGLVTAAALLVFGGEPPPVTPVVSVHPGGASLGLSGSFP